MVSVESNNRGKKLRINNVNIVMNHRIQYNSTYAQIENIAKLLNNKQNATEKIPTDRRTLKKYVDKRFEKEIHIICDKCEEFVNQGYCDDCKWTTKKKMKNFIVYIPLKQQIEYFIDKYFDEIISFLNEERDELYRDIYDGTILNEIKKNYFDCIILSMTMNADGAQPYKSSKSTFWPIQLCQNYLPPKLRYKSENIIVSVLYNSREKPDMSKLVFPLAKEINSLLVEKIARFSNEKLYKFVPNITLVTCDLPAKAVMMGMKTYSGYSSCSLCIHPGVRIQGKNKRSYIRYTKLQNAPKLRDEIETIKAYTNIFNTNRECIYGIINVSPMIIFDNFKLIDGFVIDYMHCVCLGAMKKLFEIWMAPRKSTDSKLLKSIKPKHRYILNKRILNIKPVSEFKRKPRSIFDFKYYKAVEYLHMLLYYLPYAMKGLFDDKIVRHVCKLSYAIYTLLKPQITRNEVSKADEMLSRFSDEFEQLYGKSCVTMNIHLLRHLAQVVKTAGPLWVYSAFSFESNIGSLNKRANGTVHFIEQISDQYISFREEKKIEHNEQNVYRKHTIELESDIKRVVDEAEIVNGDFYSTIKIGGKFFKSRMSKITKSIDNFFIFNDGTIGAVHLYVNLESEMSAIVEKFEIVHISNHFNEINSSGTFLIMKLSEIARKLLYMKFGTIETTTIPHLYYD